MKFQNYKSGMHLAKSVVFGFLKILRKEKKIERKMIFFFFYVWLSHEKYKRKSNMIKIN